MKWESITLALSTIEDLLSEEIQDAQAAAEAEPGFVSQFESDTGPICAPEDAAPELDEARGHVRDALDILRQLENES